MPSVSSIPPSLFVAGSFAAVLAAGGPALAQAPAAPIEKSDAPIDVRVEGDRGGAPRASRDPDVASYVVRGDELRRPGATAVDAIAASPGVEPSRSGAGSDFATISIRGAPSAQLPVYLAGIRLNDDVTGAADLSTIPLFFLDRIEIYRGNAPADADRLGIGGAVFFEPRLPRGTHAGVTAGAGSFGELSFGAYGSLGDERAGALFSVSRQSAANDYRFTDDGNTEGDADDRVRQRTNGDATTYDAWALGRAALPGGGRLVLLANTFAREQGLVGATYSTASAAQSATQREIVAASARLPCSARRSPGDDVMDRCSIEIGASAIAARRDMQDPLGELGFGSTRVTVSGERWEESARLRARVGDRWRIGAGVFTGVDRLGVDIAKGLSTRAARLSVTGSVDVAYRPIERLELFALAAGECHSSMGVTGPGAGACALGGPAGRAGLRITAPLGFEVLASAGSYVRVPALGELYGLSGTVLGNPALVPERGFTGEAGVRWGGASASGDARGYVDVTGFARLVENLIVWEQTRPDTIKPFNVARARILGVEITAGLEALRHVRAQLSVTASDPRDAASKDRADLLPYHAALTATTLAQVYTEFGSSVPFIHRVALSVRFSFRSARNADDAGQVYLSPQRDLGADAVVSFLDGNVIARLSVSNLLDVNNEDILGFPLAARSFHGGLEASW